MNVDYKGVEVGNINANTTDTFVAGRPVRISAGYIRSHDGLARAIGLIKENNISGVVNEITGQYGIYGSGKATVLMNGVVTVKQASIDGVSYSVYDETQSYSSNDDIYANTSSLLTNQKPSGIAFSGLTGARIGYVITAPTNPANGDSMVIRVDR